MADTADSKADLWFGEYRLDREDERLWQGDEPVKLGNKAFRLLLMLAEHKGRLLTKEALFSSVWDGTIVSESALTSAVKELRRALGDESKTPRFIDSVYGRGYRFLPEVGSRDGAGAVPAPSGDNPARPQSEARAKVSICVLPFANMSGDPEQEYFSDGISEDIITDLSKISVLSIVARNTAFGFKGKEIDVKAIARQLGVSHLLEGSVRRAGGRVRITAQLIDGGAGDHLWAERYDRDLTDIFAIQDEISKAIVAALQLRLLPEEKKAIERRGTTNPDAYNLYLMARQHWISGNVGDSRREEVVIRICRHATAFDPDYVKAWALMALAQSELRFRFGKPVDALAAAERALELDPNVPEARCVKARYLQEEGRHPETTRQIEIALHLDPGSWEVNKEAAHLIFRQGRIKDAIPYFEKATSLMDTDYHDAGMLVSCYQALGDAAGVRRAAEITLDRAQKALAQDPSNGFALGYGASSLAALGETARVREWIDRALLMDPDNVSMRYSIACGLVIFLGDREAALELLGPYFDKASMMQIRHCEVDPDMEPVRDDPRFREMVAAAKARLG